VPGRLQRRSSFQIGVSRGHRMASRGRLALVSQRRLWTSSQPYPPFRYWPVVGEGPGGPAECFHPERPGMRLSTVGFAVGFRAPR